MMMTGIERSDILPALRTSREMKPMKTGFWHPIGRERFSPPLRLAGVFECSVISK
jgi:hypothetical protein